MSYEQERAKLEQITPKSLPSNTAESGLSADQIQEKFWKGVFYLHDLLEQTRLAYANADVLLQEQFNSLSAAIDDIVGNVTALENSSAIANFDGLAELVATIEGIVNLNGESISSITSQIATITASITTLRNEILNGVISAHKAVRDGNGNVISSTYATKAEIAGVTSDVAGLKNGDVVASKASKDDDGNIIKNIYTKKSQIVDNVTDTSTDKPLSANQGKVLKTLIDGVTALLQSNDVDLDTVQEIVAYIKSNKTLIDSVTTSKVSVSDIIDNLTSSISNKPLSAKQGYVLKGLIDGLVPNTRKIAGVDLLDDVTSSELKVALGLENVSNTSDINKPISTATQIALDLKADKTDLTAKKTSYDNTGSTLKSADVQGAIDEHDREIEELKYAPIINKSYGDKINTTTDFVPNASGKPLLKQVDGMQVYTPQLVTNGDFSNGTTGWNAYRGTGSVSNGVYTLVGNTADNYMALYRDITVNTTDKYYIFSMLMTPNTVSYMQVTNVGIFYNPTPNLWYLFSGIFTFSTTQGRHECLLNYTPINGLTLNIKNNIRFNVSQLIANKQYSPLYNTTFNLMTDAQIKIQMDSWVQLGILPNANLQAITNTKVKTVGKNLFDKSNALLNYIVHGNTGLLTALNGAYVTDFIKVKPNTQYVMPYDTTDQAFAYYDINKNFISGGFIQTQPITTPPNAYYYRKSFNILGTNIDTLQLELGSTATTYAPYKSGTLELTHTPLYRLPNGVKDIVRYDNGQYVKDKYVKEHILQATDMAVLTTALTNVDLVEIPLSNLVGIITQDTSKNGSTYVLGRTTEVPTADRDLLASIGCWYTNSLYISFIFAKGTYADLNAAKAALTGTKIYYQLATPLLANELVNADGQLIQENPTTIIQEQTLPSLVNVDFTINVKETVKTLVENSGQSPFEALPTGTLAVPPSGLTTGSIWLDTTDSATYPILRIKV